MSSGSPPCKRARFSAPEISEELSFEQFCLNQVSDALVLFSHGQVQFQNESFREVFGISAANILLDGAPFFQHQDARTLFRLVLEQVAAADGPSRVSRSFSVKKAATLGPGDYRSSCVTFTRYKPGLVSCVFGGKELLDPVSKRHYDDWLTQHVMTSVAELDLDNEDLYYVYSSDLALDYLQRMGVTMRVLDGEYVGARACGYPEHEIKFWINKYREVERAGKDVVLERRLPMPSGSVEYLTMTLSYGGVAPSGRPRYYRIVENHTLRQRYQDELQAERNKLKESLDQLSLFKVFFEHAPIPMGACEVLPDGRDMIMAFGNAATARMVGLPGVTSLPGTPASNVPRVASKIDEWMEAFRQSKSLGQPYMFEIEHGTPRDEGYAAVSCLVSAISENRYAYLVVDSTARRLLELQMKTQQAELERMVSARTQQLEHALEVKSRFLAIVSHEIRTPLSGITGTLGLLADSTEMMSENGELVRIAQVCCDQLLHVITDILELSRLEAGKMQIESAPFCPQAVLEEALDIVSFSAAKAGLELVNDIDFNGFPACVEGDASRLRQILVNLLGNAVKFSRRSGAVILKSSARDLGDEFELAIAVQDFGVGISESAKGALFQPFQQADTSTTRKFGGSGLGLSISKRLVELMGGSINFDSVENRGSTFHFTIRTKRPPESKLQSMLPAELTASLSCPVVPDRCGGGGSGDGAPSRRLLLLEPCCHLAAVLQRMASQVGWEVCVWQPHMQLSNARFDVVVVDWRFHVAERSTLPSGAAVVFLGDVDVAVARTARAVVLKKPVRPSHFLRVLCDMLEGRRPSRGAQYLPRTDSQAGIDLLANGVPGSARATPDLAAAIAAPDVGSFSGKTLCGGGVTWGTATSHRWDSPACADSLLHASDSATSAPTCLESAGLGGCVSPTASAAAKLDRSRSLSPGYGGGSSRLIRTSPVAPSRLFSRRASSDPVRSTPLSMSDGGLDTRRSACSAPAAAGDATLSPLRVSTSCGSFAELVEPVDRAASAPPAGQVSALAARDSTRTRSPLSEFFSIRSPFEEGERAAAVDSLPPVVPTTSRSVSPNATPGAVRSDSAAGNRPSAAPAPAAAAAVPRILIAEDNTLNQRVLTKVLESLGRFEIEIVENGRQAYDAAARTSFAAILMDVMMPEWNGYESTVAIRADPRCGRVPIIAVTANAFPEDRERCLSAGMDDVITKPLQRAQVSSILGRFISFSPPGTASKR